MILENFLIAIARVIDLTLQLFVWLVIIRALISWFSPDPYNPLVQLLFRITEPVLGPLRNFLPFFGIGCDRLHAMHRWLA